MKLETYGLKLRDGVVLSGTFADQLQIEFAAFRMGLTEEQGGLGKDGHFKKIVELIWNNEEMKCPKRYIDNPWASQFFEKACAESYLGVAGSASSGKCCKSTTYVLYHDGSRRQAKDVKIGDLLMGDDGQPRKVLEVHTGRSQLYKITPNQGDPWECTEEHVLTLKRTYAPPKSWRRVGEIRDISVKDYLNSSRQFKAQNRMFCVGVDFPEVPVQLDPRMYGFWLGDGHMHNPRLSIDDSEVEELAYVTKWAEENNYKFVRHAAHRCMTCPSYFLAPEESKARADNLFSAFCLEPCVDGEKRIRPEYLKNSRRIRLELLAGIIDTDGYAAGTYFEVSTKYTGLKDDIVYLARSLGFRVTATHRMAKCEGKYFPSWRINIMGSVEEIPTLRKKCKERERGMSDCIGFSIEPSEVGDWVGFSIDGNHRHLLGDFTVTHNSDPAALWALVNYLADPTHTKILVMSTTIAGAKLRIWKTLMEYWHGIAGENPPGKLLMSNNMIKGPTYDGEAFSDASGIQLLATEKSKEKEALEKLIGIKAPKTDGPNGRIGKLILIIDEMTGATESILHAAYTNLSSNTNFQLIGLGNPNSLFDTFGLFCEPKNGWDSVDEEADEWETKRGVCMRLDARYSPRIVNNDERLIWMPTQEKIDRAAREYGERSRFFNRMFRAVFTKEGDGQCIYSPADFLSAKATHKTLWGTKEPTAVAFLDPSFTDGGDRCILYFGKYGLNSDGIPVLELDGYKSIHVNISDKETPHNYQIARIFKAMCKAKGVLPQHAAFDCTGAGGPFGDIVASEWSPLVKRVNFSGAPTTRPVSPTNRTPSKDFYHNRVSEIWYSAKPLLANGHLKGFDAELMKEICARENYKKGEDSKKLRVESKKDMKMRTNESPDLADSAFGLIDLCRTLFGFKRTFVQEPRLSAFSEPDTPPVAVTPFRAFAKKTLLSNKTLT